MKNLDLPHLVYMARRFRALKWKQTTLPADWVLRSNYHLLETAQARRIAKYLAGVKGKYPKKIKMLADAVLILAHGVDRGK